MSMLTTARCRIVQAFARLGKRTHPVRKQVFETGAGALFSVGQLLRDRKLKKPMVILDAEPDEMKNRLLQALDESDVSYVVWDTLPQQPTANDGELIRLSWQGEKCDCFVVMGDGPILDAAKAAAARCARRGRSIMNMVGRRRIGSVRMPTVIAIPTVAGTGAESLAAAIIADDRDTRFVIEDEALTPAVAVLDPELLSAVPRQRVADAGMNGLCLAIEAYLAAPHTDQKTRSMASEAAALFLSNLEECWNHGGSVKARENLLAASRMAGNAASGVGYGYVRALCRGVQTVCGVGFGLACGALLPTILEKYGNSAVNDLAALASAAGVAADGTRSERAAALIARIRGVVFRMGLSDTLDGVTGDEITEIADLAAAQANPRSVSPVVWTARQCAQVLLAACGRQESGKKEE